MQIFALSGFMALVVVVSFAVAVGAGRLSRSGLGIAAGAMAVTYLVVLATRPSPIVLGGIVGGVAAVVVGVWIGSVVVPNLAGLTAFLVTASLLDVLSVRGGPTRALFDAAVSGDGFVFYLVVLLPWGDGFIPVIGVSDLFGLAVVFAALSAIGTERWLAFAAGMSGMMFAFAAGILLGGVPAYPLLAAFALPVAVWSHRRKRRFQPIDE